MELTLPKVAPTEVNGESHYWLRVRIIAGNYGTPAANQSTVFATLIEATNTNEATKVTKLKVNSVRGFMLGDPIQILSAIPVSASINDIDLKTNTLTLNSELKPLPTAGTLIQVTSSNSGIQPPSVKSLELTYTYNYPNSNTSSSKSPFTACLSYNDFIYQVRDLSSSFTPFARNTNSLSSLYLGFDRPFPNRPIALYFQVETPTATELSETTTNPTKPRLVWEYFNGKDWGKLNAIDETAAFSDRGLIKFIGPSDFTATQEFNQTLYWLRVRGQSDGYRVPPRLRRILTNTIWASQTTTLHDEILGGSNGNPNQIFRTVKSPILPGQQLEVQEQKVPPIEEQKEIEKLERTDAITVVRDEKGEVETVWVRWHEVSDFYESGTRDRHYTLNRLTGEIQFGDGKYGLIPPQIRNNIRMARYKTDGGAKGNKPAEIINQLKTTIPFIDRVTNLEAAGGGSDRDRSIEGKKEGKNLSAIEIAPSPFKILKIGLMKHLPILLG
ncbi:hypothetical protein HC766_07150 [Candidatus Gracilibacteria bacterium]|nr:hypothetical protein [Candidatus Gracilibacteria bacterium]